MTTTLSATEVVVGLDCSRAQLLGHGGFGETWRVDDFTLGDDVGSFAVKILHPNTANAALVKRETDGLDRFESDPRIVTLHEVREVEIATQVRTVLICELIPGGSVTDKLRLSGLPSQESAVAFAIALFETVATLHDHEDAQIHRDIKPDNIVLRNGSWSDPVLIDFGLSRGLTDETFTQYPARVGSVHFMSPEQLRGEKARKSSDMWACGVVLYLLLAGEHPYFDSLDGLLVDDLLDMVLVEPPPLPDQVAPQLDELVRRLLSNREPVRGSARRAANEMKEMQL